ncbi:MAG: hypothetical protein GEV04_12500, partial [Actinophytocola sp.]|nr:hypothetical protein [Actinophytocola sp.]
MHQYRFLPTRTSLLGRSVITIIAGLLVSGIVTTASAGATHNADQHRKMDILFTSPNAKTNSDLAFWGDHAFVGYYTGDAQPSGGVRIFDISDPSSPQLIRDFPCDGQQNDPILWDRNGNGVADL